MKIPPYLFVPLFILGWFAVSFILSRMGWMHIVRKYRSVSYNTGKKLGFVMSNINGIPYRNVQCIFYNEKNIYISNFVLFRMFHPPVLMPLSNFKLIVEKSFWGKKDYSLVSEDPVDMEFRLDRSQGEELEQFLVEQNHSNQIQNNADN